MPENYPKINNIPVNAVADQPDIRDWIYQPALIQLKATLPPPQELKILNQGTEGACTGFGLAGARAEGKLKDLIIGPSRKSLLYFVSRSFEEELPAKILGMEKVLKKELKPKPANLKLIVSKGGTKANSRSASKTHGGFDNDHQTMNTILADILGHPPKHPFQPGYMDTFNRG